MFAHDIQFSSYVRYKELPPAVRFAIGISCHNDANQFNFFNFILPCLVSGFSLRKREGKPPPPPLFFYSRTANIIELMGKGLRTLPKEKKKRQRISTLGGA